MHGFEWENTTPESAGAASEQPSATPGQQDESSGGQSTPSAGPLPPPPYAPPRYAAPPPYFYRPQYPPQRPQKPKMSRGAKVFVILLSLFVFVFVAAFATYPLWRNSVLGNVGGLSSQVSDQPSPSSVGQPAASSATGSQAAPRPPVNENAPVLEVGPGEGELLLELTPKQIAKKVRPSVVGVLSFDKESGSILAEGSGIVMTEDGYMITNAHVVGNTRECTVKVVMLDETQLDAYVVGYDPRTDLAVVKASASGPLTAAEFGDSNSLEVGDYVIAIGNPGGLDYAGSTTRGIVSALDRNVSGISSPLTLIQTDAAINPGNSGGALVNSYGQVVGINSAKLVSTSYEGMGFAIPIAQAKPIVDELLKNGFVTNRVRIGVGCEPVGSLQATYEGIPQGLQIMEISTDSALQPTKAKVGDIITHVAGEKVDSMAQLYRAFGRYRAGDSVSLTLYRPGAGPFDVVVELQEDTSGR